MPGIYMALEIARKSLFVNQAAIQVTSHNIANVNTPGFSRQEAVVTEAGAVSIRPGQLGMGATVTGIRRQVDSLAEQQLVSENGVYASLGYASRAVGQVEEIFNDSSGAGLADRVNEFYNAWDDLAANPQGTAERQAVVSTAELLASEFRRVDSQLTTLRDSANRDVSSDVEEVNRIASQIAKLNGSIKVAIAQGQQPNDLLDQRGVLLKSLSEKIGYSSITDPLGQVTLFVGNGRILVEGESAGSLAVDVNPNDPDAGLVYDVKIRLPGQDGPVSTLETITGDISSGELAAVIRFRDVYMKTVRGRVDDLAYAVASQANAQHAAGYGLPSGTPPVAPTGTNFFVPIASAANAARNFFVDPAVSGDISRIAAAASPVPGDNRNSLLMAGLRNIPLAGLGNATVPNFIAGMTGQIGSEAKGAKLDFEHQKVVVNYLETRREEASGVSLDEEMTNLIRFQRAFEASTKMISILDTLLDNVINLKQ